QRSLGRRAAHAVIVPTATPRRCGMHGCREAAPANTWGMRSPPVFALVVLSATSAHASAPCSCSTDVQVLPTPGARDVPRNTKIWVVGGFIDRARLDGDDHPWIGPGPRI